MVIQQVYWCKQLCDKHGVMFSAFIDKFLKANPDSMSSSIEAMDELLYEAWHNNYKNSWGDNHDTF